MDLERINYSSIITKTHEALKGKDITLQNIKSVMTDKNYSTLKLFMNIYANGLFKAYYDKHEPEHIRVVMEFRREFYIESPVDEKEYEDLINYFENIEDYESCFRLKSTNDITV